MKRLIPFVLPILAASGLWAGERKSATFERYTLENGLTVILHEDHAVPVVAVNVWYNVGSRDEQPGKTGFAHLFEHYMFEGSEHVPNGGYDKAISGRGGENNANTTNDRTDYYAVIPAENLEETLRVESDRMCCLVPAIDQKRLDKQRAIVKNEKRLDENQPYGHLEDEVDALIYPDPAHPYHHTIIGSMEDLDRASVDDVKRFHSLYYAPNNAVLALSGDFDSAKALASVKKWFATIPAAKAPPTSVFPPYQPRTSRVEKTAIDEHVQIAQVDILYPIPGEKDPDWIALDALSSVLGGGGSSRLVRRLQYDQRLVYQIGTGTFGTEAVDLFVVQAIPAEGKTAKDVAAAVDAEIERLISGGVSEEELKRVKTGLELSSLNSLQDAQAMAANLAEGQAVFGDPGAYEAQIQQIRDLKLEALSRAAAKYLRKENSAVLTIQPAPGGQK